jgi:hypothetical protein
VFAWSRVERCLRPKFAGEKCPGKKSSVTLKRALCVPRCTREVAVWSRVERWHSKEPCVFPGVPGTPEGIPGRFLVMNTWVVQVCVCLFLGIFFISGDEHRGCAGVCVCVCLLPPRQ